MDPDLTGVKENPPYRRPKSCRRIRLRLGRKSKGAGLGRCRCHPANSADPVNAAYPAERRRGRLPPRFDYQLIERRRPRERPATQNRDRMRWSPRCCRRNLKIQETMNFTGAMIITYTVEDNQNVKAMTLT